MSKILEIYPHEKHISDNQVDTTKLSSTAQTALVDFAELKAEAVTAEAANTLVEAQVSKLELYSKTIYNEVQDYLDEIAAAAEEEAQAKLKADADAKAKADADAAAEAQVKADADAAAKKAQEEEISLPWMQKY